MVKANTAQSNETYPQLETVGKESVNVNEKLDSPLVTYEGSLFLNTIKNIQSLDILLALQECRCYTLPRESLLDPIVPADIVRILAKRDTNYQETLLERKFRKDLGFYAFKIIRLCITNLTTMHFR